MHVCIYIHTYIQPLDHTMSIPEINALPDALHSRSKNHALYKLKEIILYPYNCILYVTIHMSWHTLGLHSLIGSGGVI